MPVLDGISAAERIGRERIAPVVMLTAFSQRELVERARDAGAMAYVVKPFTAADLVPAIEIARRRCAELRALEAEVADLGERLETRKAVDRAKGVLMTQLGAQRAGGVPVDPEDGHGPAPRHARGRRGGHHGHAGTHVRRLTGATTARPTRLVTTRTPFAARRCRGPHLPV